MHPGEEAAAVALVTACYPIWPKIATDVPPVEHLRWKLSEPNYVRAVIGEIDGGLAGMSTRSIRPVKLGGSEVMMQQGYDSCVLPKYRDAHVMSAIRGAFTEVLDTRGDLLMFVSDHPAFTRIRGNEGATSLYNRVHSLHCDAPFDSAQRAGRALWKIVEATRFDARVDSLWEQASWQFDLIATRRADWLNWRFCDSRGGSWKVTTAEQDGKLLGYIVHGVVNGTGQIADLLALPGRIDVVESLIADALADFAEVGAAAAQCWCPTLHPYRTSLVNLGFTSKRKTLHLAWVGFTDNIDRELLQTRRLAVHYMGGDSDLV
jgi:hypothetical protein